MEVPRKRAKTCPGGDLKDDGSASATAAQQIAELQAELDKCKRENIAAEERHDQVVHDLKGSYSDALDWAYSTKAVPRAHWLEKGHTEEYADAMEELLNSFKQIIKELRMGTVGDGIQVEFGLQEEGQQDITATHDDMLMPHWKEFANALIHWSEYHADEETLTVSIIFIETPDAVLDVLRRAIKQSKVGHVGFVSDGTPKTWKLAEFIGYIIQTNHKVTTVGFSGVVLSNEEWKKFCNSIRIRNAQQVMNYLGLGECFVDGVNTEVLKDILTSNTAVIGLEENGMSSREASIIAEHLNYNPSSLTVLALDGNRLDDAGAAVLANSLSSNTNLRTIDVEHNNIKEEGRLAFLRAIFHVSSLALCAASNHTCQVWGLGKNISALNCRSEDSDNKWDKIFAMLACSGDSFINTALLSGTPASLMPVLLYRAGYQYEDDTSQITDLYLLLTNTKRCQKHDVWDNLGDVGPLNCVYELIRSWVVPTIYV